MTTSRQRDQLAASITRQASTQTYTMIRFFVDRGRTREAFRAYAYFRWVDDILDASTGTRVAKLAFARRQRRLLNDLYQGQKPDNLQPEEQLLLDLVVSDPDPGSGLGIYLERMMRVMEFDARRRGRLVTEAQLDDYTENLAVAVTEAMHYFIGRDQPAPRGEARYQAVTAAHITHMLRDALDDTGEGYYNIPHELLLENGLNPFDHGTAAYQRWVCQRVSQARDLFRAGRNQLSQVKSWRCRLAGLAYTARFEWVLRTIERENFCLREEYTDRKRLPAALWMAWNTLRGIIQTRPVAAPTQAPPSGREAPAL